MDIRKVKKLIELVEHSEVAEIEIADDEGSIRITRTSMQNMQNATVLTTPQVIPTAAPMPATPVDEVVDKASDEVDEAKLIRSPMVGTFYAASSPDQEAFVKVGSNIAAGQTICIVEAMKVMNQITAEFAAEIVEVLVSNAQPVEYNQPLFRVK